MDQLKSQMVRRLTMEVLWLLVEAFRETGLDFLIPQIPGECAFGSRMADATTGISAMAFYGHPLEPEKLHIACLPIIDGKPEVVSVVAEVEAWDIGAARFDLEYARPAAATIIEMIHARMKAGGPGTSGGRPSELPPQEP